MIVDSHLRVTRIDYAVLVVVRIRQRVVRNHQPRQSRDRVYTNLRDTLAQ